jgi:hypothetical protein
MSALSAPEQSFTLRDWIIVKSLNRFFLVGHRVDSSTIYCSTAIASLNATDMTCRTIAHEHYRLLQSHLTDADAQSLLEHFRIHQSVDATDATAQLLEDPNLLYLSFTNNEDAPAKVALANAYLTLRAAQPMQWLTSFIGYLVTYDVDPRQLAVPLGLSDVEWQLMREGKLFSVSTEVALRGWLLDQILTMIVDAAVEDPTSVASALTTAEIAAWRIPPSLLRARETRELLDIYRFHLCLAEITASVRA